MLYTPKIAHLFPTREDGPLDMAGQQRGKPSNYQLPEGLAERAIQIIRERYADFSPTLACEKLAELHRVVLSRETMRKLMILSGLWIPADCMHRRSSSHAVAAPASANSSRSTAVTTAG